jgi:hypothetical protein
MASQSKSEASFCRQNWEECANAECEDCDAKYGNELFACVCVWRFNSKLPSTDLYIVPASDVRDTLKPLEQVIVDKQASVLYENYWLR